MSEIKPKLTTKETNKVSISKRFLFSFSNNILRTIISFVTGFLIARFLGPEDYGRMAFLIASFMAIKQLLDMATSEAFFTFISRKQRGGYFVSLFWRWIAIQLVLSIIIIGLILPEDVISYIWEGESKWLVLIALVAGFMQNTIWPIASQMAEAQRETIRVQKLATVVISIHFVVVIFLWIFDLFVIPLLLSAMAIEWAIASWLAARMYKKNDNLNSNEADTVQSTFGEFWQYCLPFIPYSWLGFAHDLADRWMLQHWSGSVEQAYYAVSRSFSLIVLVATSSILNIFWKEISEAQHNGDHKLVKDLYHKVVKILYLLGALVAGAMFPWASEILVLTVGERYLDASLPMMVMLLYPVHQSLGQISSSFLLASGNQKAQVIIGIPFMLISFLVAYFMLAPSNMGIPGLQLASSGLAFKMVIMQLIQVNIIMWWIARVFKWKFDWSSQFIILALTIFFGLTLKFLVVTLFHLPMIFLMMLYGLLYLILVISILYFKPTILGYQKDEFKEILKFDSN